MNASSRIVSLTEVGLAGLGLLLGAAFLFSAGWILDFGGSPALWPWELVQTPGARDALAGLGEVTVALLGIAVTVVAIILELAANRYTPRVSEMFIRNPVNVTVMGFYVVTSLLVLWTGLTVDAPTPPRMLITLTLAAMCVSIATLLPYFAYVFDFVTPTRIVAHIRSRGEAALHRAVRGDELAVDRARGQLVATVEHLGEMAVHSVCSLDKTIAIAALDALCRLAHVELQTKEQLPEAWQRPGPLFDEDRDFAALPPATIRALAERRTWVLMKILRQYEGVFREGLKRMMDVEHLVAIRTRQIAAAAAEAGYVPDTHLAMRFLNTFLRASINAGDVRTAYNLLNEYRLLAQRLMELDRCDDVLVLAHRMKDYGQIAFHANLPFVLETVAYDLCELLERAHEGSFSCHDALLDLFMDVDREPEHETQEASLRGVRKAQVRLATAYLERGDRDRIAPILAELRAEHPARLASIHCELASVESPEYWEVSDRGLNFDYLTPSRKLALEAFFRLVYASEGEISPPE